MFAVYKGIQYLSQADEGAIPEDVVVTNLTTNSLTITWFTDSRSDGYVIPILNSVEQSPVRDKRGSGDRTSHYVELKGLEPSTKYAFTIVSEGDRYTNSNGTNYEFTTAPVGVETPIPNPVHGSVTGISSDDVVVYIFPKNKSAYPVSTTIPSGGNWIVDLSSFRKVSDKSLVKITDDTDLVLLAKSTSNSGVVLDGAYAALFDSNGKLNQTLSLEIGDSEDLISYFPDETKLGVIAQDTGDDQEQEQEEEEDSPSTPSTPSRPSIPSYTNDGDDDEEEIDTNYVITHDLRWIDMVAGGSVSELGSGEDTVMVTNLTDVGFSVVWRTLQKVDGYIKYGTNKDSLTEEVWDVRDGLTSRGSYYSHSVESKRVDPSTTYYFEVYSGQEKYDDGGQTYSITTFPTLSSPPPFETKSGSIENALAPGDWIVIAKIIDDDEAGTLGSSKYVSTIPDDNGNWILTVGDIRSDDGNSYFSYSNSDILSMNFLGDEEIFNFPMSTSEISLDTSLAGNPIIGDTVKLLSDYGIINIK